MGKAGKSQRYLSRFSLDLDNLLTRRNLSETAVYAKLLLSITVEQAAHWIDAILPPLPNAATLTGYSPLPPPPNDPYVPASILDRRFGYHIPASEAQDPLPYNYPTVESHVITSAPHSPPRPHFYYHSRSDWYHLDDSHTSHFALTSRPAHSYREYQDRLYLEPRSHNPLSVPPLVNPVNLALVRFPQRFTMQDIVDLFPKNCPPIRVLRLESSTNETYAIVQVEEDAVTTWIKCLDGIELEGRRKMRCFVTEMTGFEIEQNERQYMRPGWTSDLIRYTLPPILSRTLSIPSALSTPSTSKSTLVKKPRSSFSLSSYLHRPPRSNPVPTTVLVLNLPLNVNLRHLCRFGLTSEKHRFEQFKARGMAVAIVEFGSKTSAKRFQNRYNEGQEKKGRLAVMMESDKSVEQCIKEHFAVIDSADQGARVGDEAVFG